MKKYLFIIFGYLFALQVSAQTIADMFQSMPDAAIPSLNDVDRLQLIRQYAESDRAKQTNIFGDTLAIDVLTDDFLSIQLNEAHRLQLKLLPGTAGEKVLCMVQTFYGPAAESLVRYYDTRWEHLNISGHMKHFDKNLLTRRPEGMEDEEFSELKALFDPFLVQLELSAENTDMTATLSMPQTNKVERERIRAILQPCRLTWE